MEEKRSIRCLSRGWRFTGLQFLLHQPRRQSRRSPDGQRSSVGHSAQRGEAKGRMDDEKRWRVSVEVEHFEGRTAVQGQMQGQRNAWRVECRPRIVYRVQTDEGAV